MKKFIALLFLSTIVCNQSAFSQTTEKMDSLGLPGDNLDLYAVLDLFQKSETFEIFEKQLNSEDSKINNLDLNNDGKTDYIKVIDHQTGESHAVVLQVLVNEKETQDVAVVEIEKNKDGKVVVQIVGNEDLYGKDYIVEPKENDPATKSADAKSGSGDEGGNTTIINNTTNNYYGNSNQWPIVNYVYGPSYVVYVSPWSWYSYPMWWNPWAPWYWHSYYWHHHDHYHHHHHGWYHRTSYYRTTTAHAIYAPHRTMSATVVGYRDAKVYNKTYASKDRNGDGKIGGGKSNPAYNKETVNPGSSREKGNSGVSKENSSRDKGNSGVSKPNGGGNSKEGNGNSRPSSKPSAKPSSKPSNGGASKPSSKPSSKPQSAPRHSSGTSKMGGGKGGR